MREKCCRANGTPKLPLKASPSTMVRQDAKGSPEVRTSWSRSLDSYGAEVSPQSPYQSRRPNICRATTAVHDPFVPRKPGSPSCPARDLSL